MIAYIACLLTALLVLIVVAIWRLNVLIDSVQQNTDSTENLRLTSRTRINEASIQSGPVTLEQQMTRLGRASVGRRVVYGGEAEAPLNVDLRASTTRGQLPEDDA
jgi:hypothetical protein